MKAWDTASGDQRIDTVDFGVQQSVYRLLFVLLASELSILIIPKFPVA